VNEKIKESKKEIDAMAGLSVSVSRLGGCVENEKRVGRLLNEISTIIL
jgi:hypothetical protein